MSYFGATGTPVLDFWWRLLWVSKPEWFCLIRIAEANVMYISWDPPLVLHIADLLTDSIVGRRPGSYLAQGYYCVAAVSLEPAINRSWVPRANHSATRPGPRNLHLVHHCLVTFIKRIASSYTCLASGKLSNRCSTLLEIEDRWLW